MGVLGVGIVCIFFLVSLLSMSAEGRIPGVYTGGSWQNAHATFYGGSDASGTMGRSLISLPYTVLFSGVGTLVWVVEFLGSFLQVGRVGMVTFTAKVME